MGEVNQMGRGVMEQSSLAHRKPSEDVFVSALSVEQGSSGTDLAGTCEEERAVLPATTVVKRLAASLYGWTAVLMLVLVVEIYSMIHLVLRLSFNTSGGFRQVAKGTILGTYGASAFLLISLQAGLSLLAAHNINCARKSSDSIETTTSSLQKAIIYLSTIFNVLSLNAIVEALTDLALAAILWPQIFAAITISVLCISAFWVSGFVAVQLRYGHCRAFTSDHLIHLLSTPPEELERVPWYIKMWMFQVFGRLAPHKPPSKPGKARGIYKFNIDLAKLNDVKFGENESPALKLLPEAMMAAGRCLAYAAYGKGLVIATLVINKLWSSITSIALSALQNLLVMVLVLSGSILFSRAIADNNSDMLNLVYGFDSLRQTFIRISIMVTTASLGQLISLIVADVS